MMPRTTAANISIFFGLPEQRVPTSSACTSGGRALGMPTGDQIRAPAVDAVAALKELCPTGPWCSIRCTPRKPEGERRTADQPASVKPSARDGLVIGEGGGMLVLEELEHALGAGAPYHAEIVGFGSSADGQHTTRPEQKTMRRAMELALEDAGLGPAAAIGYMNGHGTCATDQGDIAETLATSGLFGSRMAASAHQKASRPHPGRRGALVVVQHRMMNRDQYVHTFNLDFMST